MSAAWRVIDLVTFEGSIGYRRGQLLVTSSENVTAVPLADVAVVLLGQGASIRPSVLHAIAQFDVCVLVCDWKGVPQAGCFSWSTHGRVAARHLAQADLALPRRKNAWGRIVRAKVLGQAATASALGHRAAEQLLGYAKSIRSGDPGNIEALAARVYWRDFFAGEETSRSPQSGDSLNPLLDYGYGVLRGIGIRAVLAAGLSPALGIFHRGRGNYFNLVDDLIEPFRPAIDWRVAQLAAGVSLSDAQTKRSLVAAAHQPVAETGATIPTALEALAQQYGRYVEGDAVKLDVPCWIPCVTEAEDSYE